MLSTYNNARMRFPFDQLPIHAHTHARTRTESVFPFFLRTWEKEKIRYNFSPKTPTQNFPSHFEFKLNHPRTITFKHTQPPCAHYTRRPLSYASIIIINTIIIFFTCSSSSCTVVVFHFWPGCCCVFTELLLGFSMQFSQSQKKKHRKQQQKLASRNSGLYTFFFFFSSTHWHAGRRATPPPPPFSRSRTWFLCYLFFYFFPALSSGWHFCGSHYAEGGKFCSGKSPEERKLGKVVVVVVVVHNNGDAPSVVAFSCDRRGVLRGVNWKTKMQ